uniref:Uncharacterized protein n=1 Tax=Glossina austeni TaxID=7395 RepID=A0A1A9VMA2_GLOAU
MKIGPTLYAILIFIYISNSQTPYVLSYTNRLYDNRIAKFNGDTSKYLNFRIRLPNDTTRTMTYLSLQLLTQSSEDNISTRIPSPITTTTLKTCNRRARNGDYKPITINNVIEAFRKDLIKKNKHCTLKCSYCSNYVYRELNIYCYEFNDSPSNFGREDGGGNGSENEYEASPVIDRSKNDIYVKSIDIKDYLETLHMSIQ